MGGDADVVGDDGVVVVKDASHYAEHRDTFHEVEVGHDTVPRILLYNTRGADVEVREDERESSSLAVAGPHAGLETHFGQELWFLRPWCTPPNPKQLRLLRPKNCDESHSSFPSCSVLSLDFHYAIRSFSDHSST